MIENITKTLADFTAQTSFEDLPDNVVHETKRILLDSIGCAVGANSVEKGKIVVKVARDLGGKAEATVLGSGDQVSAATAAYANGELINTLDFDNILCPGHVSPYVIPTPLAMAERHKASGKTLIVALALAHEVGARVGISLAQLRGKGGLPSRAVGNGGCVFGAAAGASKVLGFDPDKTASAFGIAGVLAPVPYMTKWAHTAKRSSLKYTPAGWTAQTGVMAGLLTQQGMVGDTTILDGEYGFWAMHGTEPENYKPERTLHKLGQEWLILTTEYKSWPCVRPLNSSLDAFTKVIEEHNIKPEEIEKVVIRGEAHFTLPAWANPEVKSGVDAQFVAPYCVAVAAHRVKVGPQWQQESTLADPGIRRFMDKVKWEHYPKCDEMRDKDLIEEGRAYIVRRPARAEVQARGKTFVGEVDYARWTPVDVEGIYATDEVLAEKLRDNARDILPRDKVERLIEATLALERLEDTTELTKLASAKT
ncbi:MAG: MmgE/PrpD family protein [Chloroflexota bacterium]